MIPRIVCGLLAVLCLAACDREAGERRWRERQEAVDPPQLWSVEALDASAGVRPVRICTDTQMRTGFLKPAPVVADRPCVLSQKPVEHGGQTINRCDLDGDTYMIISDVKGDTARDFTVSMSVSAVIGDGPGYSQNRRYKLVGPCPAGWKLGDRTLQSGAKVSPGVKS